MNYYLLLCETGFPDLVSVPDKSFSEKEISACLRAEPQLISTEPKNIQIDDPNKVFHDMIMCEDSRVILISRKLKNAMDSLKCSYAFFRRVNLVYPAKGIEQPYFMIVPPRIRCLIESDADGEQTYTVNPQLTGRYDIFKPAEMISSDIIITERLKTAIENTEPSGIYFETAEFYDVSLSFDL